MNDQVIKKTTKEIQIILIIASILVGCVGSSLYFFSEKTEVLFSWTITPSLTAAYLGGGYLAAFVLEYLASRESKWANARIAVPGVWAFTIVTLLVTIFHIDRFHFNSSNFITLSGTWVWLLVYIIVPVALGIFWIRQVRLPGTDPARENKLPRWLHYSILIQGLTLLLSGTAMILLHQKTMSFWPWALSALTSRAIGAWGIGNGIFTIQAFLENDWRRLKVFMPSWGFYGFLQLVNVLIYNNVINWGQISAWIYLIFMIWILIVGGYGTLKIRSKTLLPTKTRDKKYRITPMEPIDILIIGGGPAGISTALHLVQSAPHLTSRILVLEKALHPRPKLCGGGLVKDAEILLEHLGMSVNEVPCVKAKTLNLNYKEKGIRYTQSKGYALRIIRRDEFDAWLANKATEKGILIREGIRVRNLEVEDDYVIVHTDDGDFHAKVVVGADGSNSATRRSIFPDFSGSKARVLEVLTPSTNQNLTQHSDTNAYFDFLPVPQGIAGYIWDFPTQVDGQSMRCWGIYDANLHTWKHRPPLQEILFTEMKKHGLNPGSLELKGHPISGFTPFNLLSKKRVLLVGDAAGTDPLFGEGISMALGYGKVAADAIIEAFKHQQFDFNNYRQRLLFSPLGRVLTARWVVAKFIYNFRWGWFHFLLWRVIKPITLLVAWLFMFNWGKRMV